MSGCLWPNRVWDGVAAMRIGRRFAGTWAVCAALVGCGGTAQQGGAAGADATTGASDIQIGGGGLPTFATVWTPLPEVPTSGAWLTANYVRSVNSVACTTDACFALIVDKFNYLRLLRAPVAMGGLGTLELLETVPLPQEAAGAQLWPEDDAHFLVSYVDNFAKMRVFRVSGSGESSELAALPWSNQYATEARVAVHDGDLWACVIRAKDTALFRLVGGAWSEVAALPQRLTGELVLGFVGADPTVLGFLPYRTVGATGTAPAELVLQRWNGTDWKALPVPPVDTADSLTGVALAVNTPGTRVAAVETNFGAQESRVHVLDVAAGTWRSDSFPSRPPTAQASDTARQLLVAPHFDHAQPERLCVIDAGFPMQVSWFSMHGLLCLEGTTWSHSTGLPDVPVDPVGALDVHYAGTRAFVGVSLAAAPQTGRLLWVERP